MGGINRTGPVRTGGGNLHPSIIRPTTDGMTPIGRITGGGVNPPVVMIKWIQRINGIMMKKRRRARRKRRILLTMNGGPTRETSGEKKGSAKRMRKDVRTTGRQKQVRMGGARRSIGKMETMRRKAAKTATILKLGGARMGGNKRLRRTTTTRMSGSRTTPQNG